MTGPRRDRSAASERSARGAAPPASLAVHLGSVFLGALLLFQIQPLVAKTILPWYGGTAAVWTSCLLVFQLLLFCGYGYAHLIVTRLSAARQALLHALLMLAACAVAVVPGEGWKPQSAQDPVIRIPIMLIATVGLPFFVLSATGPLLQTWCYRLHPERSPYPLYALSNAASMLALLGYPFLVEPNLALRAQTGLWSGGFYLFVVLCGVCAWMAYRASRGSPVPAVRPAADSDDDEARGATRPGPLRRAAWIAWSACGVILFMSVTNQLSINVASIPFLWVLPLSIYLLTFIVAFGRPGWYSRRLFSMLFVLALIASYAAILGVVGFEETVFYRLSYVQQIWILAASLFVFCMVCNGELYRLRPAASRLTGFYLAIALGGVIGGVVVAVLAPRFFLLSQEFHLGLLASCGLLLASFYTDPASRLRRGRPRWAWAIMLAGFALPLGLLVYHSGLFLRDAVHVQRNAYGLLRVLDIAAQTPENNHRRLYHGSALHGSQFTDPAVRGRPTVYYSPAGGGGAVLARLARPGGRRVGVVGLGVGTLAAYGRPEDTFRFYEIDPDVAQIAEEWFTYLADSQARWEIALGDARLSMEREPPQEFDVLVLDAFSSDAIPVHLLTTEAFDAYDRHLKSDGVIAVHISNRSLDLTPILYLLADSRRFQALNIVTRRPSPGLLISRSNWMILSRDTGFLDALIEYFRPYQKDGTIGLYRGEPEKYGEVRVWTDDYSNLFQVLK